RDLAAGVMRAVGGAEGGFRDARRRRLRAVPSAAQFDFPNEETTKAAVARNADALKTLSMERIRDEFNRILVTPKPGRFVYELCELGLMTYIVPQFLDLKRRDGGRARHKDNFEHTLIVLDRAPPILTVRWGALLHDIATPRS